jgi:hypothetical protein
MLKLVAMGLVAVLGAGLGVASERPEGAAAGAEDAAAPAELGPEDGAVPLKACTGVDLKVKNQYSHKIKVKKFEYQVGGSWKTEQVNNTEVGAESTKVVASNQSLGDAEGKNITGLKITFQAWCNNAWGGDHVKTDTEIDNEQCNSSTGKTYRFDTPDGNLCD